MGKMFGILLIVLGVWVGLEFYLEGTQGAFGGALTRFSGEAPTSDADRRSTPQRFGDAIERAQRDAAARTRRALDE